MPRPLCLLLLLLLSPVLSAADLQVHGLQLPAWVERDGRIQPLRPGVMLQPGDVVHTGAGGRVEIDLPEGSVAKLGAGTTLALPRATMRRDADGELWDAALHLLRGAFRFTTRTIGRSMRRDLRLRVGVATIGVRGTDFWVRADAAGDELLLIEGRISLVVDGQQAMMMEQPMDHMMVMPDGRMEHLDMRALAPDLMHAKMDAMLAMTEMESGAGMLMMGMPATWDVVVMSLRDSANATRVAAGLTAAGYPVDTETAEVRGATYTRLVVRGLASRADALGLAAAIEGVQGISGAWIKRSGR